MPNPSSVAMEDEWSDTSPELSPGHPDINRVLEYARSLERRILLLEAKVSKISGS